MELTDYIFIIPALIIFGLMLSELYLLIKPWPLVKKISLENSPLISVLVCVRNEENTLRNCLVSLVNQEYQNKEILVIDDHSSDSSSEILKEFSNSKLITLINAEDEPGPKQNPKAFLLNKLRPHAKGDFLAIADADCEYASNWLEELYQHSSGKAILSGTAGIKNNWIQNGEWLGAIGRIALLPGKSCPIAVGNNMMLRTSALDKIGGFSSAMDSLTEDVKMNYLVRENDMQSYLVNSAGVVSRSQPVSIWQLFPQRARWMKGLDLIPWYLKVALYIQSLQIVWIAWLWYFDPLYGISGLTGYFLLKISMDIRILFHLKQPVNIVKMIILELYRLMSAPLFVIYSIFGGKIKWKERKFDL